MELKKVDKNLFDVFVGQGWLNWSRVKVEKDDVVLVTGLPLSKTTYKSLKDRLCKYVR